MALRNLPVLLFGFLMGVWVDRARRLRLFTLSSAAQGLVLMAIPIGAIAGYLRIEWLYAITFCSGFLASLSVLASTTFLPSLVEKEQLVLANARIQVAHQVVRIGGKGLGGILVETLSAPIAVVLDAISYWVSAGLVASVPIAESPPKRQSSSAIREIREGVQVVFRHPLLRALVIGTMFGSFAASMQSTVIILFAVQDLHLDPAWLGGTLAMSSLAGLLGSTIAEPVSSRLGPGPALSAGIAIECVGIGMQPFLSDSWGYLAVPALAVSQGLISLGLSFYSIVQISLRQAITPDHVLGRVNATRRVVVFGVVPLGALVAGFTGEAYGLRTALGLSAAAMTFAAVYFAVSPLGRVRSLDAAPPTQVSQMENG